MAELADALDSKSNVTLVTNDYLVYSERLRTTTTTLDARKVNMVSTASEEGRHPHHAGWHTPRCGTTPFPIPATVATCTRGKKPKRSREKFAFAHAIAGKLKTMHFDRNAPIVFRQRRKLTNRSRPVYVDYGNRRSDRRYSRDRSNSRNTAHSGI